MGRTERGYPPPPTLVGIAPDHGATRPNSPTLPIVASWSIASFDVQTGYTLVVLFGGTGKGGRAACFGTSSDWLFSAEPV